MDRKENLSIKQLGDLIGLSRSKILGMCERKEIPFWKVGRQYKFDYEEVKSALKNGYSHDLNEKEKKKEVYFLSDFGEEETCEHEFEVLDVYHPTHEKAIKEGYDVYCERCYRLAKCVHEFRPLKKKSRNEKELLEEGYTKICNTCERVE